MFGREFEIEGLGAERVAEKLVRGGVPVLGARIVQKNVVRIRVDGKGGYFQNVRRLAEFSRERVVLRGREGGVCVEGHDLSIGKYYAGDIVIAGDIVRVERLEREDAGVRQRI